MSDTKDMVNKPGGYMGITFDDVVCAKLTQDFGAHSYLIRDFGISRDYDKTTNGNGRMSRLLTLLLLYKNGYSAGRS